MNNMFGRLNATAMWLLQFSFQRQPAVITAAFGNLASRIGLNSTTRVLVRSNTDAGQSPASSWHCTPVTLSCTETYWREFSIDHSVHTGNVALLSQPAGPNLQYVSTFSVFMRNNFENVKTKQFILYSALKTDKRFLTFTTPPKEKSCFPLMWATQNVGRLWSVFHLS